jgi:hypothetical protein
MPGAQNLAQAMGWNSTYKWFGATGVPITPYDDATVKNYYPMMRLMVKDLSGAVKATTDIVLPVSDEIDCKTCHASGSTSTSMPAKGWAYLSDPEKDYKTNVLNLHDEKQAASPAYATALANAGYNAAGLMATVNGGKPILCAKCHGSNALGTSMPGVSSLTSAIHANHASVIDPTNNLPLDSIDNRSACYRCHPGSTTACLRGAMGTATAPDGSQLMQCQSCHGSMSLVGTPSRQGWLQEPACQSCHTGTATHNNGDIRYTSVFESNGQVRVAVDSTFATDANTPSGGLNLYRYSSGHGGLQCEACHGSTHAEYPSSHTNDNVQSIALQGYAGTVAECSVCHATTPRTVSGGPHGLHPLGQSWVNSHGSIAEGNTSQCRACHGSDYRGTVLSETRTNRSFRIEGRTIKLPQGTAVSCYNCHNGPNGD